jgi:dihydropteroate synthase
VFPVRRSYIVPLAERPELRLGERPLVMGVLNVTPDSFAESSPTLKAGLAIDRALQMQDAGADIIDVGGESTRPGTEPVGAQEELARILPVIKGLAGQLRIPISIDTYRGQVAQAAIDEGASIVNDISGLQYDPPLAGVVARSGVALVLMHMRGRPREMYAEAVYGDVIAEVTAELRKSVDAAVRAGVPLERIIVDPGLGFAKRPDDSYGVLARLSALADALDRPMLVGPSRKSFMRNALGGRPAIERDWGTAAAVTAAVLAGAHVIRVHAVAEMVQVVRVAEEIRRHAV